MNERTPMQPVIQALGLGKRFHQGPLDVTVPCVGASSPPIRCSSVLLPEPDAPTMAVLWRRGSAK